MESSIISKAFRLLEAVVSSPGSSLTQLAGTLELTKPSAHRVLGELRSLGLVKRDSHGGYMPAAALWRLLPGHHGPLLAAAEPVMRKLWKRTEETVNLGILRGEKVQYLQVFNSNLPLRRDVTVGELDPALTTALGRAMATQLDDAGQARLLEVLPRRMTPQTLTTRKALQEAISLAAEKGYAIDREETDLGVVCLAAPIHWEAPGSAALSLSLPTARLEARGGVDALASAVKKAAAAISRRLRSGEPMHQPH